MSSKAIEKLLGLAAEAERAAAAYRMAAAALNGHAVDKRVARSATVLGEALELDAARRKTKPKPAKKAYDRTGAFARARLVTRERTARVLALVEQSGPMTAAAITEAIGDGERVGFSPLIQGGYLKPVGDKYKRTAKPFTADWRKGPPVRIRP